MEVLGVVGIAVAQHLTVKLIDTLIEKIKGTPVLKHRMKQYQWVFAQMKQNGDLLAGKNHDRALELVQDFSKGLDRLQLPKDRVLWMARVTQFCNSRQEHDNFAKIAHEFNEVVAAQLLHNKLQVSQSSVEPGHFRRREAGSQLSLPVDRQLELDTNEERVFQVDLREDKKQLQQDLGYNPRLSKMIVNYAKDVWDKLQQVDIQEQARAKLGAMLGGMDEESVDRALASIEAPASLTTREAELRAAIFRVREIVEAETVASGQADSAPAGKEPNGDAPADEDHDERAVRLLEERHRHAEETAAAAARAERQSEALAAKQAELDKAKADFAAKQAELDKTEAALLAKQAELDKLASKIRGDVDSSSGPEQPSGQLVKNEELKGIERTLARRVYRLGEKFSSKPFQVLSPERSIIVEKLAFFPELQVHEVEVVIVRKLFRGGHYLIRVDGNQVGAGVRGDTVQFDLEWSRFSVHIQANGNITDNVDDVFVGELDAMSQKQMEDIKALRLARAFQILFK
jgi:hypothetical protein